MCEFLLILIIYFFVFFFFKQKTAYEMRISDWSSDVCSSDLQPPTVPTAQRRQQDYAEERRPDAGSCRGHGGRMAHPSCPAGTARSSMFGGKTNGKKSPHALPAHLL